MFAMLTGCGMYQAKSAIEWLTCHARQPPPHLVDGRPELADHGELDALLQRCLAKRPEQRPDNADAMIAMIERLENGQPAQLHASTVPRKLAAGGVFSPSSFITALAPNPSADATLVPPSPSAPTKPDAPHFDETGPVPAMPSRRGTWLAVGALAVVAMVVAAIAVASSKQKKSVDPAAATAKVGDAGGDAAVAMVVVDAGIADAPTAPDAGVIPTKTPRPSSTAVEVAKLLASAEDAQRTNQRMKQIRKADAARALDPHNVRAILLLADGLIAYGDLGHGCKYLRELGSNAIARQRIASAGCPAN
jgi:serine/threonine-protein kinase